MPGQRITAEMLLDGLRPGQLALAPDGQRLAFSVAPGPASFGEKPSGELWVAREHQLDVWHRIVGWFDRQLADNQ